jgi:putative DNA primase/helicase
LRPLDARLIAKVMGGEVTGPDSVNAPGPGHSPHDRSLSIKVRGGRIIVFSHCGDDWRICRDYALERLGLEPWQPHSMQKTVLAVASSRSDADNKKWTRVKALEIWGASVHPQGTLVEQYLMRYRGLSLPDAVAGHVVRFHGALWFDRNTRLPGMVCLFRNIKTNEPCGIHRTFLDRTAGDKVDRRMFGVAKDAAIKFDNAMASEPLIVGEGIETALSAREAGFGKTWAVGSSGAIRTLPILDVPELSLLQENDATSRRDSSRCARRYLAAGKPVTILRAKIGNDLNDVWRLGGEIGR